MHGKNLIDNAILSHYPHRKLTLFIPITSGKIMTRLTQKDYKSPLKKLVRFFEKSRDNWKVKYQTQTKENKRLKNRVNFLQTSKQKWRDEALTLRKKLQKTQASKEQVAVEFLEKKQHLKSL